MENFKVINEDLGYATVFFKGGGANPAYAFDGTCLFARERYGGSIIEVYCLFDESQAITDIVLDLRKVYKKFARKMFQNYEDFLQAVYRASSKTYFLCNWKTVNDEEITTMGIALCHDVCQCNRFVHCADIMRDVENALDVVLNKKFNRLTSEEMIAKRVIGPYQVFFAIGILGGLLALGGIALIILGQTHVINVVVGMIFGILAALVGLFVCPMFTWIFFSLKKDYLENRLSSNKVFNPATYSKFGQ